MPVKLKPVAITSKNVQGSILIDTKKSLSANKLHKSLQMINTQLSEDLRSNYSSTHFYIFDDFNLVDTPWINGNFGATGYLQ